MNASWKTIVKLFLYVEFPEHERFSFDSNSLSLWCYVISPTDSSPIDSSHTDSSPTDSSPTDSPPTDSSHTDSSPTDSSHTDSFPTDVSPILGTKTAFPPLQHSAP